jgi:cell wall-associated NlpC family hydrolase
MTAAMNGGNVTSENLRKQSIQLGKALNDPVKGMTALRRVGVSFTEEQTKQVTALVASGKTMQAQKLILHELNKEFGGSAAASATTQKKLGAMFGELEEATGKAILPLVNAVGRQLLPVITALGDWMQDQGVPLFRKFGTNVLPIVVDIFKSLFTGISTVVGVFQGLPGPVKIAIAVIGGLIIAGTALTGIMTALAAVTPFGWVAIAVTAVVLGVGLIQRHWQTVLDFFKGAGRLFNTYVLKPVEAVFDWIKAHWPLLLAIFTGPFGLIVLWVVRHFGAIRDFVKSVMDSVGLFFLRAVDNILGGIRGLTGVMGHLPGVLGAPFRAGSDAIDKMRDHIRLLELNLQGVKGRQILLKIIGKGIWSVVQDITKQFSSGGHVRGAGGPTDDQAGLFALSDNEWVIRAASASRYGDKAMHAVNQGTATIWAPGMASGGVVQGSMPTGTLPQLGEFTVRKYDQTAKAIEDSVAKATIKGMASGWGNGAGGKLVSFLSKYVGRVPYVWGGRSPAGWDCSGMVQYGLRAALGINAPGTSETQYAWVRRTADQRGALAFFDSPAGGTPPGHVGVSLGNGRMINAAGTQWGTIYSGTGGNMGFGVPPGFAAGGKVSKPVSAQQRRWLAQLAGDVKRLHADEKAAVKRRKILRRGMDISELWFLTHPRVKEGSIAWNEQRKALRRARHALAAFNNREAKREGILARKIKILRELTGFPRALRYGGPGRPGPDPGDGSGDGGGLGDGGGDGGSGGGTTLTLPITTPPVEWQGPYSDAIGSASPVAAPVAAPAMPSRSIAAPVRGLSASRSYGATAGSSSAPETGGRMEMFLARMCELLESGPHMTGQVLAGALNGQAGTSARRSYYSAR